MNHIPLIPVIVALVALACQAAAHAQKSQATHEGGAAADLAVVALSSAIGADWQPGRPVVLHSLGNGANGANGAACRYAGTLVREPGKPGIHQAGDRFVLLGR